MHQHPVLQVPAQAAGQDQRQALNDVSAWTSLVRTLGASSTLDATVGYRATTAALRPSRGDTPVTAAQAAGNMEQAVTAARQFGPTNTNPFTGAAAPAGLGLPANILQQIEVIGYLLQGNEDVGFTIPATAPHD